MFNNHNARTSFMFGSLLNAVKATKKFIFNVFKEIKMFLEWQQIGKWLFDGTDIGDKAVSNEDDNTKPATDYGSDRFNNIADTPLLKMTPFINNNFRNNTNKVSAVVSRENGVTYCRCRFTAKFTKEEVQTGRNISQSLSGSVQPAFCGLKIVLDENKTKANDYPVLIKYKMRINNPDKIDGYSTGGNFWQLFNIDKDLVDGEYKLVIKSKQSNSEIGYALSQKILDGEWFDVEILWTPEKETVRLDGWSIGSDDGATVKSPLGTSSKSTDSCSTTTTTLIGKPPIKQNFTNYNHPSFDILTSFNCWEESPDFDIGEIEVRRIYERTVTPPSIKITSEVIDDTTVRLTAVGYTGVIPSYDTEEEEEETTPGDEVNGGNS